MLASVSLIVGTVCLATAVLVRRGRPRLIASPGSYESKALVLIVGCILATLVGTVAVTSVQNRFVPEGEERKMYIDWDDGSHEREVLRLKLRLEDNDAERRLMQQRLDELDYPE